MAEARGRPAQVVLVQGKSHFCIQTREDTVNLPQEIFKSLIGELRDLAKTETIVGAPIAMGEYTVIPISRVSLGVAAGGGTGESNGKDARRGGSGEGGGGGGGVRITPVALVAVRGAELSVHRLGVGGSLGRTVERVPDIVEATLEKAFAAWQARQGKEGKTGV